MNDERLPSVRFESDELTPLQRNILGLEATSEEDLNEISEKLRNKKCLAQAACELTLRSGDCIVGTCDHCHNPEAVKPVVEGVVDYLQRCAAAFEAVPIVENTNEIVIAGERPLFYKARHPHTQEQVHIIGVEGLRDLEQRKSGLGAKVIGRMRRLGLHKSEQYWRVFFQFDGTPETRWQRNTAFIAVEYIDIVLDNPELLYKLGFSNTSQSLKLLKQVRDEAVKAGLLEEKVPAIAVL
jgi:hypothetical protein